MKRLTAILAICVLVAFTAPAFAANPFMDVPAGHWAYDAVAQLAARGVVSGYPDGAYTGAQHATRYEMASVVARALAKVDVEKASKQELEMLKKLVMEFKDELDALGVKVEKIDKRVAVLEDRVGGWRLNGSFTFDANWGNSGNTYSPNGGKNWYEFSQGNIALTKHIDENNYVYTRFAMDRNANMAVAGVNNYRHDVGIDRMFWNGKIGDRFTATVGRFAMDWELDAGLRNAYENDSWFNSAVVDGFKVDAQFTDKFDATAVVARNITTDKYPLKANVVNTLDYSMYALRFNGRFTENFWGGITGNWLVDDNSIGIGDISTYGAYLGFNAYADKVGLRAFYYAQDVKDAPEPLDSPKSWKAALTLNQDLLKFTSLWVEYGQTDAGFFGTQANAFNYTNNYRSSLVPFGGLGGFGLIPRDSKFMLVRADQKWNDKWSSFLRYAQADYDMNDFDKIKNYTVGVQYQYTPAVAFQLAYDDINYGNTAALFGVADDDKVIRFRTTVNF